MLDQWKETVDGFFNEGSKYGGEVLSLGKEMFSKFHQISKMVMMSVCIPYIKWLDISASKQASNELSDQHAISEFHSQMSIDEACYELWSHRRKCA